MSWLTYFQRNQPLQQPIPWHLGVHPEPHLLRPLIASLQRFQLGESGEGRRLKRLAATLNDPDYTDAIGLFIAEEQRHAALMAQVLRAVGARLLRWHWSDAAFVLLRRIFGLREELLVLLVPEMMARRFFRALDDGTRDPVLRAVFAQIIHDEEGHVAFHIDTLRQLFADTSLLRRVVTRVAWRVLYRVACLAVICDHHRTLRTGGVSPLEFWWDCGLIFDEAAAQVLCGCELPRAAVAAFPGLAG